MFLPHVYCRKWFSTTWVQIYFCKKMLTLKKTWISLGSFSFFLFFFVVRNAPCKNIHLFFRQDFPHYFFFPVFLVFNSISSKYQWAVMWEKWIIMDIIRKEETILPRYLLHFACNQSSLIYIRISSYMHSAIWRSHLTRKRQWVRLLYHMHALLRNITRLVM